MTIPKGRVRRLLSVLDKIGWPSSTIKLLCSRRCSSFSKDLYHPPFALTILATAFAGRTTISACGYNAMMWDGVWRFAYTPYETYTNRLKF